MAAADAQTIAITAQGGVDTVEEQDFLRRRYGLESVGWGTPWLLVPEVMNVQQETVDLLSDAGEDDLYLSDVSPLGVPFNNVRGNSKDLEKEALVAGVHDDGVVHETLCFEVIEQSPDVVIHALHASQISFKVLLVGEVGIFRIRDVLVDLHVLPHIPVGIAV